MVLAKVLDKVLDTKGAVAAERKRHARATSVAVSG
jgi:hypothetical protein